MPSKIKKTKTCNRPRSTTKTRKRKKTKDDGHLCMTGFRARLIDEFKATYTPTQFANHNERMQAMFEFLHKRDPRIDFSDFVCWIEKHDWICTFGEGEARRHQPWTPQFETLPDDPGAGEYKLLDNSDTNHDHSYLAPETAAVEEEVEYKDITLIVEELKDLEMKADSSDESDQPVENYAATSRGQEQDVDHMDTVCATPEEVTTSTSTTSSASVGTTNPKLTTVSVSMVPSNSAVSVSNNNTIVPSIEIEAFDKAVVSYIPNALNPHAEMSDSIVEPLPVDLLKEASPNLLALYQHLCDKLKNKSTGPIRSIGNNSKPEENNARGHNQAQESQSQTRVENGHCVNGLLDNLGHSTTSVMTSPATKLLTEPGIHHAHVTPQLESAIRQVSSSPFVQPRIEQEEASGTIMDTRRQTPAGTEPGSLQLSTIPTTISNAIPSAFNETYQLDKEKPGTSASFYNQHSLPMSNGCHLPLYASEENALVPIGFNALEMEPVVEPLNDHNDPDDEFVEYQIELAMKAIDKILQISDICSALNIRSGATHLDTLCTVFQRYKKNLIAGKLVGQQQLKKPKIKQEII